MKQSRAQRRAKSARQSSPSEKSTLKKERPAISPLSQARLVLVKSKAEQQRLKAARQDILKEKALELAERSASSPLSLAQLALEAEKKAHKETEALLYETLEKQDKDASRFEEVQNIYTKLEQGQAELTLENQRLRDSLARKSKSKPSKKQGSGIDYHEQIIRWIYFSWVNVCKKERAEKKRDVWKEASGLFILLGFLLGLAFGLLS